MTKGSDSDSCTDMLTRMKDLALKGKKVKEKVAQWYPTLCDPMDYTVHGIIQIRLLEWVDIPFFRGIFPTQGSNPGLLHCWQILYQLSYKGIPVLKWTVNNVHLCTLKLKDSCFLEENL